MVQYNFKFNITRWLSYLKWLKYWTSKSILVSSNSSNAVTFAFGLISSGKYEEIFSSPSFELIVLLQFFYKDVFDIK